MYVIITINNLKVSHDTLNKELYHSIYTLLKNEQYPRENKIKKIIKRKKSKPLQEIELK